MNALESLYNRSPGATWHPPGSASPPKSRPWSHTSPPTLPSSSAPTGPPCFRSTPSSAPRPTTLQDSGGAPPSFSLLTPSYSLSLFLRGHPRAPTALPLPWSGPDRQVLSLDIFTLQFSPAPLSPRPRLLPRLLDPRPQSFPAEVGTSLSLGHRVSPCSPDCPGTQ